MDLHGSTWIYYPKKYPKKSPNKTSKGTCSTVLMLKTRRASKPQTDVQREVMMSVAMKDLEI